MTITNVQGKDTNSFGSAGTFTNTLTNPVGVGNAIVGSFFWFPATNTDTVTITDDVGNTYTNVDRVLDNGTTKIIGTSFYLTGISNGPQTFTATFPTSSVHWLNIDEFSGIASSSALDGHNGNLQVHPGNGTDGITSGSFTTTSNGDLVYGATLNENSIAAISLGTGFSAALSDIPRVRSEFLIQSTAGSISVTFTSSNGAVDTYNTVGLALKAAPPAVVYVPPRPVIRPVVRTYYVR